jgi:FkbH-like protein
VFEIIADQPAPIRVALPHPIDDELGEMTHEIALSSGLVWAEHCTDCAWPICYSNCALYTPRADLKCRRFENGIEPVILAVRGSGKTQAMRIRFRQWGKLETSGSLDLFSPTKLGRMALLDQKMRSALPKSVLPFSWKHRGLGLWLRLRSWLQGKGEAPCEDDFFLVEAVNEGEELAPFTLTFVNTQDKRSFFQHGFVLAPGYNRVLVKAADIARMVNIRAQLLIKIEPTSVKISDSFIFTRADLVRMVGALPRPCISRPLEPAAKASAKLKCVVWDLDNTVWRGVLTEDGPESLLIRPEVERIIKALDERGVLQSVVSKNQYKEAAPKLEQAGLFKFMLYPQINWEPKSQGISRIAAALDIGIDTFLFVDDQIFEREEVRAAHPDIRTLDPSDLTGLLDHEYLDLPITAESRKRREMYQDEAKRKETFVASGTNFRAFLRSCDIRLRLFPIDEESRDRVFELAQRTNQLNYSGARLSSAEVLSIEQGEASVSGVVLQVSDRFGDYGIVGFATIDRSTFTVTNFFMSCRVQRKNVENAFFSHLLIACRREGREELRIRYRPTLRNGPAQELLQNLGAMRCPGSPDDEATLVLLCSWSLPDADIVSVEDHILSTWGRETINVA